MVARIQPHLLKPFYNGERVESIDSREDLNATDHKPGAVRDLRRAGVWGTPCEHAVSAVGYLVYSVQIDFENLLRF